MILAFMQKWKDGNNKGKPTFFVQKIWMGFSGVINGSMHDAFYKRYIEKFNNNWDVDSSATEPKIHTIRRGNRWKKGNKIHFAVNNRTSNYFQFAPVLECVSVQHITFDWTIEGNTRQVEIYIDGDKLGWAAYVDDEITFFSPVLKELAVNDGFDNLADFLEYFYGDFQGQIIHWTDKKY